MDHSVKEPDYAPSGVSFPVSYEGKATTRANLVLEGGAMRGMFTAGVLDVFLDRGLLCDSVIGVSAGALMGYNYVAGQAGRGAYVNLKYCTDWRYLSLKSFVRTGNAFGREMSFDLIPNVYDPFPFDAFDESPMKLTTVASDLELGEADYHTFTDARADLPYLIASSSMPMVSEIVEVDGKKLLDGGTCDSVPITYSKLTGSDKHIVVCTQDATYRKSANEIVEVDGKKLLDGGTCDSVPITYSKLTGSDKHIVVCTQDATYRKSANKLMPVLRQRFDDYPYYIDRLAYRHYEYNIDRLAYRHYEYNRTYRALERMHENGEIFLIRPGAPVEMSNLEQNQAKLLALYEHGAEQAVRSWDALERYLAG